ncbi:unnamed protein product [Echinostoma caproni]|uniref:Solute carrier family 13 member 2 n=1 Tax=Echinostoma caproni TaxID=27848 RepID=A0A183AIE1_9TREM|nr:unnamed protein product [Echinostoma caproni]
MGGYWLTEVIPIYVTALLPIVLGPMLGLMKSSQVCQAYMKDTNMLFIGGLFVATTIEHRGLHKRIAISVLRIVGSDPKMTPHIPQMLEQGMKTAPEAHLDFTSAEQHPHHHEASVNGNVEINVTNHNKLNNDPGDRLKAMNNLCIGLSLSICYSSTCGGIATITGTAPNSILFGLVNGSFCSRNRGSKRDAMVNDVIAKEVRVLGKFTYAEGVCCILFLLITLLWVTRNAGPSGWDRFFNHDGEM